MPLPHQERVVAEREELYAKYSKLGCFFGGPIFIGLSNGEQSRLRRQYAYMGLYLNVLQERIDAFPQV